MKEKCARVFSVLADRGGASHNTPAFPHTMHDPKSLTLTLIPSSPWLQKHEAMAQWCPKGRFFPTSLYLLLLLLFLLHLQLLAATAGEWNGKGQFGNRKIK